ncbi:N-acetylglucosamine-6-phosphate deacetylase [Caulobacter vibrioides]|uniref:N-acetylglucosamine-6-phosphate deacetylase n=2 Tax=Caulobacter vibrioides TaxID=155892 RepID=Q9AAR2_CAUVC|nr:N-acetylglucosamine-6-phosphate deacetylase [Caulobacter vibrioides]YP_002515941.1 N-acetylglucosamine-6-phosphate deacetylase [Caulobacter vibrioides NA1000]AAK22521.1 N-acetylglucosamine-6-phosphate deacetylase [Caulobacter vibrioides CB15]ACL94033.1 N-acetylglucosamine-6-phosphate deacetylase [Caulobacter vibrioides NA1000]ATC27382.1 N-acetylglucosamine-6-phosphate deacetylase [Caulobacter vibrioides]QXZ52620.1 N-acetylglucosamine-6-phosphate deacetylase [Caulobacter vibrioides]
MPIALVNGRVLTPAGFVSGKAVLVENGVVVALLDARDVPADAQRHDLGGDRLVPGFIDTQVNGGGGALFNDAPTARTIATIGEAHRAYGTTGFLPTLISDDLEVVDAALRATEDAIAQGVPGVLGVHIEGPFLNPKRKGIHDEAKFRVIDEDAIALLSSLKRGKLLLTLAPERTTPDIIARLAAAGVIVAAGHTNAHYETMRRALDHGLTGVTHLFNAMSPLTSREPGVVGAVLENQNAWAGIIVDGRHVDPVTLKIALRTRPLDRFMLVTDAMPTVGLTNKRFNLQGREIVVRDGVCVDEAGTLAGSDLDMAAAVRNAVSMLGLTLEDAVMMASAAPSALLGLQQRRGAIAPGLAADFCRLDDALNVTSTWIDGKETHARQEALLV